MLTPVVTRLVSPLTPRRGTMEDTWTFFVPDPHVAGEEVVLLELQDRRRGRGGLGPVGRVESPSIEAQGLIGPVSTRVTQLLDSRIRCRRK